MSIKNLPIERPDSDKIISNVSGFFDEIERSFHHKTNLWYRGHSDKDYELIPASMRKNVIYSESRAFFDFQLRFPENKDRHETMFDWLTLLQHYHVPTRLLDWSENVLHGLFFACNSEPDKDGCLHVIEPNKFCFDSSDKGIRTATNHNIEILALLSDSTKLRNLTLNKRLKEIAELDQLKVTYNEDSKTVSIFQNDKDISNILNTILPVKPKQINERLKVQQGVFTIHGGKIEMGEVKLEPAKFEDEYCGVHLKLIINKSAKKSILDQLSRYGITEDKLFPDMASQGQYIRKLYYSKRGE